MKVPLPHPALLLRSELSQRQLGWENRALAGQKCGWKNSAPAPWWNTTCKSAESSVGLCAASVVTANTNHETPHLHFSFYIKAPSCLVLKSSRAQSSSMDLPHHPLQRVCVWGGNFKPLLLKELRFSVGRGILVKTKIKKKYFKSPLFNPGEEVESPSLEGFKEQLMWH